ncbi:MAG: winged helix-turn-helix domain-containing protein [Prevotellaceae bacterium]|nr:winged helix-turn-helix domain-containing protein [Prevotellaceae bacterium]
MVEKKETRTRRTTGTRRAAAPKKAAAKAVVALNAENVGFKAGDVYQALAASEKALTVVEIAKAANISEEETLLGLGWLFKEGKIKDEDNKIVLA